MEARESKSPRKHCSRTLKSGSNPISVMMPVMNYPMDASMVMMMMGTPMMPMSNDLKTQMSMEEMTSMMSRMKSRAQSAHEAADVKMKMHLRSHEARSDGSKAPCKHAAMAPQAEPLEASQKKAGMTAPYRQGGMLASPAGVDMKPMLSQPLIQMSPALLSNGGMSAALMAPQMMPMSQYPTQSQSTGQAMMTMMAPGAFPQNVVAMQQS